MNIEGSYPTPVHGVSTLTPRNRMEGQAGIQTNFRSDPVNKLTRRNYSRWLRSTPLFAAAEKEDILVHSYERDGETVEYIVDPVRGWIYGFVNDIAVGNIAIPVGYRGPNFKMRTIEHDTYFINTDKVVALDPDTDEVSANLQRVVYLNVTSALNYNEAVTVAVTYPDGVEYLIQHSVPDLGDPPDYDTADRLRATAAVAAGLADSVNNGGEVCDTLPSGATACITYPALVGVTAVSLGSCVAIWLDDNSDWLELTVASGQGQNSVVSTSRVKPSLDGLPLYAVENTRIEIKPDPNSAEGSYFLESVRVGDHPTTRELVEVVWVESRAPDEPYRIDPLTTPLKVAYDTDLGTIFLDGNAFNDRSRGDNESVPVPAFVGETITDISLFQKRLVVASENTVTMSRTDDHPQFFKESAISLLVTDVASTSTSALGADTIRHIVPHNRDLLVMTNNAQFKLTGDVAITPESIALTLTTRYQSPNTVPPVLMGNIVYFATTYGASSGIQAYTGQKNTSQDRASLITNHVVGLLDGDIVSLATSPNLEIIVARTTGAPANTLYVYEEFTDAGGTKRQQSWSTWELNLVEEIIHVSLSANSMLVYAWIDGNVTKLEVPIFSTGYTGPRDIHMDSMYIIPVSDGVGTLPLYYENADWENLTAVYATVPGTSEYSYITEPIIGVDGNDILFDESVNGTMWIGRTFESRYSPTRPFVRDDKGIAVTSDRLRITSLHVSIVETNELSLHVKSPYYDYPTDEKFNSRPLDDLSLLMDVVSFTTDDVRFSFGQEAKYATAELYCDNHLPCTIAGISWAGQYNRTAGRI